MNKVLSTALSGIIAVAAAGLVMNFGRDLPVIKQARQGFDS